nr:hypothetical protein GCM10025732_58920 [Glycomyces mayteni]
MLAGGRLRRLRAAAGARGLGRLLPLARAVDGALLAGLRGPSRLLPGLARLAVDGALRRAGGGRLGRLRRGAGLLLAGAGHVEGAVLVVVHGALVVAGVAAAGALVPVLVRAPW